MKGESQDSLCHSNIANQATCQANEPLSYHWHPRGHIWSPGEKNFVFY